jgi:hypothetical protein
MRHVLDDDREKGRPHDAAGSVFRLPDAFIP